MLMVDRTEQTQQAAFLAEQFRHALEREAKLAECLVRVVELNPRLRRRLAAALKGE
jgi:hypothetical protein